MTKPKDIIKAEKYANKIHKACKKAQKDPIVSQCFEQNLACACAIASYGLWEKLLLEDIDCELICGSYDDGYEESEHCWVQIDEWIVDPTFSQFGGKSILISKDIVGFNPELRNKKAIKYIWTWEEQSPKYFYFEWNMFACKLSYKQEILNLEKII